MDRNEHELVKEVDLMHRALFTLIALIFFIGVLTTATARTVNDIPEAGAALRRTINPTLYRSVVISPVEGWIVVRGELVKDHLINSRVIRSELNGRYDSLGLELANNLRILNYTQTTDQGTDYQGVLVNLLIYRIADGRMALSFAYLANTGGGQLVYSGTAWMALQRSNEWVTVKPLHLAPNERHGPRSYSLAVETPGSLREFGNGRLPMVGLKLQGGQHAPLHMNAGH